MTEPGFNPSKAVGDTQPWVDPAGRPTPFPPADAVVASLSPGALSKTAPAPQATEPPTRQVGGYTIVRTISRGGQGVVYLARQPGTRRQVALKVLPRRFAKAEGSIERFRREAQAAARLDHPNIVPIFESGESDGLHYIAMEFIDGHSLAELLRQEVGFSEAQVVEIARGIARALQHAHDRGVLHRDVKPANILLTRNGRVKLTDFGLAKYESTHVTYQTQVGQVFGTPAFVSPEQTTGAGDVDRRSDLYSFGCVIYNLAAGRPPFLGEDPFVVMDQHRRLEPSPISHFNPRMSDALQAVVNRAMAKVKDRRYQSASEVLRDLDLIRGALRAPDQVRGGLSQIVAAVDQINVVGRLIRDAEGSSDRPHWRTRVTAAFLRRPMFWFGITLFVLLSAMTLMFWLGFVLAKGT